MKERHQDPQVGDQWKSKDGRRFLKVTKVTDTHVTVSESTLQGGEEYGVTTATRDEYATMAAKTILTADFIPAPQPVGITGSSNTHARLAPSSSKCWTTCTAAPAFLEANAHRVPKDTGSSYANEGTEAHEWAAKLLLKQITEADVPESFRTHVTAYVNHCTATVPKGTTPMVEVEVPLFYQPNETGTCDFASVTDSRITVRDLKYGAGVLVESFENTQLAIYAFSLVQLLEDAFNFTGDTVVDIAVFQPRHRDAEGAEPWILTLRELTTFCLDIEKQATIARNAVDAIRRTPLLGDIPASEITKAAKSAQFNPGEDTCRWCRCKAFCDANLAHFADDLSIPGASGQQLLAFMPDAESIEDIVVEVVPDSMPSIVVTDEYILKVFKNRKRILQFLDYAEEYLDRKAREGAPVQGTKLVLGRQGNREWSDEDAAETFLKGQGLKQEERFDFKLKSPAAIEKVLKDKLKNTRTANRFAQLVTRSEAKIVLALDTDKREAVQPTLAMLPNGDDEEDFDI